MLADDLVEEVALAAHAAEPAAAQPSDTEVGSGTPRSDGDAAPGVSASAGLRRGCAGQRQLYLYVYAGACQFDWRGA